MNKNFDIFISFKATENGVVTDDLQSATELYDTLTKAGFRVFFSSKTLLKGGSSDFSREIDNALDSARLLIVVASKLSYINSRWVEYEWKTFNGDILSNVKTSAQIITYTKGLDSTQFPRILRYVQNFSYEDQSQLLCFIYAFFNNPEAMAQLPEAAACPVGANDHTLYSSSHSGEFELLRIRARRSYAMDMRAIEAAKNRLSCKKYNVLVLGCAYGFVAETRFGLDDDIDNVICVDKNPEVLQKARELYSSYSHMKFYQADVQTEDYVPQMQAIMEQLGIDGFDLVFSSDLFRYLNNPQLTIRKTRKLLRSGGMLIIRDCDDSGKMAYPDEEKLLEGIITQAEKAPGMPNYRIGRELPLLVRNCGFRICDVMNDIQTTLNLSFEEKEEFFLSTFGSRKSIAKQILGKDVAKDSLQKLVEHIDRMEEIFYNADFWYSETNMLLLAEKQH